MAVDHIGFLRMAVGAVGVEQVDVEEVRAVLVAVGIGEVEDVLADVPAVEGLLELGAVAVAEGSISPFDGMGERGKACGQSEGSQGARGAEAEFHLCVFELD